MTLRRRLTLSATGLIVLLLIAVLAACDGDSDEKEPAALAHTPTVPPVITRIVPAPPTLTPTSTATLSYDMLPVTGRWTLLFDVNITGGTFADTITYSGAGEFEAGLDGSLHGSGEFSVLLRKTPCDARALDNEPITFDITGSTFPQGEQVGVDIQLVPDDPARLEPFLLVCPDATYERSDPFLWPVLAAVNKMAYRLTLEPLFTIRFEEDLAQITNGNLDGIVTGEVQLARG